MSSSTSSTPSPSARLDTLSTTKRIRTSKPKVRSGCVTCKARRIKCDEIKPACDRCTKFGRECGGYKLQLTYEERAAARNGRSRILPKVYQASPTTTPPHTHQLLQAAPNTHSHLKPSPLPLPPNINLPLTPHQIFCIETSLELCRTLEFPVWTSIKVELSKQNPFISHAFSAIRMLSKGPPPTPSHIDPQLSPHDPNLSSLHTQRFLEGSRLVLSNGPHQPLLAAIICLLVTTLETLQFHHEPALSHIQLGLALIPQFALSNPSSDLNSPPFFVEEVIRVFQMLEAKATFLDSYFQFYAPMPLGFASPFVMPQLMCAREEVLVDVDGAGAFESFVFAEEPESGIGGFGQSRGSSVVVGTP